MDMTAFRYVEYCLVLIISNVYKICMQTFKTTWLEFDGNNFKQVNLFNAQIG